MSETFKYIDVDKNQISRMNSLRYTAGLLEKEILDYLPNSKEGSLAIGKLEECIMWANKGISRSD